MTDIVRFPPYAAVRALYKPVRDLVEASDLAPAAIIGVLEQIKFEQLQRIQEELDREAE